MSILGPAMIDQTRSATYQYPPRDRTPRREPATHDGHRTTTGPGVPDLDALFKELNRTLFGATLPLIAVVYADLDDADGQFLGDEILIKRGMPADKVRACLIHEMVHAADLQDLTFDIRDPHGPSFQKIARALDPHGPTSAFAARSWQPRNPTGTYLADVDYIRSASRFESRSASTLPTTGKVRAKIKGSIGDMTRPKGDQELRITPGMLVDADHWAVRQSPHMFEEAP